MIIVNKYNFGTTLDQLLTTPHPDPKWVVGVCRDDDGKKDARLPKLRRVEWRFCDHDRLRR